MAEVMVSSLHPNQPGDLHVLLDDEGGSDDEVGHDEVVVMVGAGEASEEDAEGEELVADVMVEGSLHPNQPGVSHVFELLEDEVVLLSLPVVVVSSRQPHHPGVLHVSVLVRE